MEEIQGLFYKVTNYDVLDWLKCNTRYKRQTGESVWTLRNLMPLGAYLWLDLDRENSVRWSDKAPDYKTYKECYTLDQFLGNIRGLSESYTGADTSLNCF